MQVKLIGITKPVNSVANTASALIGDMARVSNPKNQGKDANGLLKYLIKHKHWSPFEMVHVVMEITTTRDISRQILRHRSFSFQEFSQRYAEAQNFTSTRQARLQDYSNRQNSIVPDNEEAVPLGLAFDKLQRNVLVEAKSAYRQALDLGIAKEQARALLPEGLTETTMYMGGTLRSWIHYVELRSANGTQREHMDIAVACRDILKENFPFLNEYWENQ